MYNRFWSLVREHSNRNYCMKLINPLFLVQLSKVRYILKLEYYCTQKCFKFLHLIKLQLVSAFSPKITNYKLTSELKTLDTFNGEMSNKIVLKLMASSSNFFCWSSKTFNCRRKTARCSCSLVSNFVSSVYSWCKIFWNFKEFDATVDFWGSLSLFVFTFDSDPILCIPVIMLEAIRASEKISSWLSCKIAEWDFCIRTKRISSHNGQVAWHS